MRPIKPKVPRAAENKSQDGTEAGIADGSQEARTEVT